MIQPVRLRFPQGAALAAALWRVLEEGAAVRLGNSIHPPRSRVSAGGMHLQTLLAVARERLLHPTLSERSVWVERRELNDLLKVLDDGLCQISRRAHGESVADSVADSVTDIERRAVGELLSALKQQLPVPRKPAKRQSAIAKSEPLLAATAGGV